MIVISLIIAGIILGSFFNMLIYRLPRRQNIATDRSRCPSCGHTLSVKDLIPVLSYLIQLGRCRYCRSRIPVRYLLCELITPAILVSSWLAFGLSPLFAKTALFLCAMEILFFTDLETYTLPDSITLPLVAAGLIWNGTEGTFLSSLYGALIGMASYGVIAIVSKWYYKQDAMGMGDIKLGAAIGAFWGVRIITVTVYFSFILGGIFSVALILLRIKKRTDHIPFGPWIIAASLVALYWGDAIWRYYFG